MQPLSQKRKLVYVLSALLFVSGIYALWQVYGETTIGVSIESNSSLRSGLVLHYTFDGKDIDFSQTSAEIQDRSSSGLDGDWQNIRGTTTKAGRVGQALALTGYADQISVADNAALDFAGGDDFSIALWMHPTGSTTASYGVSTSTLTFVASSSSSTGNTQMASIIADKPTGTAEGDVILAAISGDDLGFSLPSGFTQILSSYSTTSFHTLKAGYLVAGASEPSTYTANVVSANERGRMVLWTLRNQAPVGYIATTSSSTAYATSTAVLPSITTTMSGALLYAIVSTGDGSRDYSTSEPAAAYTAMALNPSPVGGTGNANTSLFVLSRDASTVGTYVGTTTISGGTSTIVAHHVAVYPATTSVESAVSVDATTTILSKSGGTGGGYKLYIEADGDLCFSIDDDSTWGPEDSACTSGTNFYTDNAWHHVILEKDGTTGIYLYVDDPYSPAARDTSLTATGNLSNNQALYIGDDVQGTYSPLTGNVDDVRIYNRLLTEDERSRLFDIGNTTRISTTIRNAVQDELLGYWTMDGTTRYTATSSTLILRNVAATTTAYFPLSTTTHRAYYAEASMNGEDDVDYLGKSVSFAGDVNGDGLNDIVVGADSAEDAGHSTSGIAYLFYSPLLGEKNAENADAIFYGTNDEDQFGFDVGAADVNGDGLSDVIVGAPLVDGVGINRGSLYIFYGGNLSGNINAEDADVIITGPGDYSHLGNSVSSAGDMNSDGYEDIIVGSYGNNGEAYIFWGPLSGSFSTGSADASLIGTNSTDYFGRDVSGGIDMNEDGYLDILVSADRAEDAGTDRGRAYVFYGPLSGSIAAAAADAIINGTNDNDYFGWRASSQGDINGDGVNDVLVSAYQAEDTGADRGRTYLFHGPLSGSIDAENADAIINGQIDDANLGWSVSAGDVNGDGYDDVLTGALNDTIEGTSRGIAYLFYGPISGNIDAENADIKFTDYRNWSQLGNAASIEGDVNNDGLNDVLVGAYLSEDHGAISVTCGRAYLFTSYSSFSATTTSSSTAPGSIGQAYDFDGTSHSASVGDMTNAGAVQSVSFWLYPHDSTSRGILKLSDTAKIELDSSGNASTTGSGWTNPTFYVNGVLGNAITQNAWNHLTIIDSVGVTATNTIFGKVGSSYFDGRLDDIRFYGKTLTTTEINRIFGLGNTTRVNTSRNGMQSTGLISHWSFNGSDVGTSSPLREAYNVLATTTYVATSSSFTPTAGRMGQAVDFNGTSDYLNVGNMSGGGNVKSVSFWIKADDITTRGVIDLTGSAYVELDGSSQITATGWTSPTYYVDGVSGARTIDGDWHHVVVTSATGISPTTVKLGRVASSYFDGRLDEVRFYSSTLSADEVNKLHGQGG